MPKAPTKNGTVKQEPKQPTPAVEERAVVYPNVSAEICTGDAAIVESVADALLGWETEKEYQTRMQQANPGTPAEAWVFGEAFMLKDEEDNKVRCWNNLDNRPFDEGWCRGLAQTVLNGQWAGPTTIPGETVNGSTIVVSKTGKIESGQHSLVAVKLAAQMYRKNPDKYPAWANVRNSKGELMGPCIETIVITGISEDPRVLMTVDNCKPRSEADVFYTSELFRALQPVDRKECSRMLATAVDVAWKRTDTKGYKTHAEVVAFVDRHPKLLKCVEHLFTENPKADGRPISKIRISAGAASALCYLMGCSGPKTDGDVYRNGLPPSERATSWERWDKAKEFWALIGKSKPFLPVRLALARLMESSFENEDNQGMGGRMPEKLSVLQKAWDVYVAHDQSTGAEPFSEMDLAEGGALYLSYNTLDDKGNPLPDGQQKLLDIADFGGIDLPQEVKGSITAPPPNEKELAEAVETERKRRAAEEASKRLADLRKGVGSKPVIAKKAVGPAVSSK